MGLPSKYTKTHQSRFTSENDEKQEHPGKRLWPAKAIERIEHLLTSFQPAQLAARFLNSLTPQEPRPTTPLSSATGLSTRQITANDISVTGYQITTAAGFGTGADGTVNAELSFGLTGTAYQSLINGMLSRANSTYLQPITQVDPTKTYNVQLGFSIDAAVIGTRSGVAWQGAFQVFDPITGQGSMAYGWTGSTLGPSSLASVLPLIVASATRPSLATDSTFNQPNATSAVPQQIVASVYVQNFIGQNPSLGWPPNNIINGSIFDPIPTNPAFAPTSFPA